MCNLSEEIEEKAIEQGIEQGKSVTIYDLVQTEVIPPAVGADKGASQSLCKPSN